MSELAFDGYGCIAEAEKAWRELRALTARFDSHITESDGLGWCVRQTLDTARRALRLCPVQPGDHVEIAKRYDCTGIAWPQHQFEVGVYAEVVYVELRERGYRASIRFEREFWRSTLDGELREMQPGERGMYPGVPVEYLQKVEADGG